MDPAQNQAMKGRPFIFILVLGSVSLIAVVVALRFRPQSPSSASSATGGLPAIPDLSRWPRSMQDHLARATKAAADPKESITALGELAQLYFSNGFTAEAAQTLQVLIKADAANARWPYLLGYLEEKADHREAALSLFSNAASLAPGYAPALIHQANLLALSGQSELARQIFNQCLALSSPDPRALYGLAKLDLINEGEPAAIKRLRKLVDLHPNFQDAHFMLAELLDKAGERQQALEQRAFLANGQGAAPDLDPFVDETYRYCYNTHRLQALGEFRNSAQAYAMALPYLERAARIDPQDPEIQDALARTYIGLARWNDAQVSLQQALQASGPNELLTIRLSEALLAQKKGKEAVAVLLNAEKNGFPTAAIKDALGLAHMSLGQTSEAIEAFTAAVRSDPILPDAQFNLARCYLKSGEPLLARPWAERALKLRPDAPDGLALLTISALQTGDIETATSSAYALARASNNAAEYRPLVASTLLRAGNLAAERGEHIKAEKIYRAGLSINESDGQLHGALGMLFGKLHRYAEAKQEFEIFVRLEPRNALGYLLLGTVLDVEKRQDEARLIWKTGLNIAVDSGDSARADQLRKLLDK